MTQPLSPAPHDASALTFEQARALLEQTVAALEQNDLTLEEALRRYEEGFRMAQYCMARLDQAELRIRELTLE